MRAIFVSFLSIFCIMCSGCIAIPTDFYGYGTRRNVSEETEAKLAIGITTKEDVLLALGQPDLVMGDGATFIYTWEKIKGVGISLVPLPNALGAPVDFQKDFQLRLKFDENDILVEKNFLSSFEPWLK